MTGMSLRAVDLHDFEWISMDFRVRTCGQEPYHDPETVTDELVDVLLSPLLQEGTSTILSPKGSISATSSTYFRLTMY